jgi:hypothetical protein
VNVINYRKNINVVNVFREPGTRTIDQKTNINVVNTSKGPNEVNVSGSPKIHRVCGPGAISPGRRRTYTHVQTEVSAIWEVVHNLGSTQVLVEIYTEEGDDLDADYRIIDENTLVVEVNPPMKGYVVVYE